MSAEYEIRLYSINDFHYNEDLDSYICSSNHPKISLKNNNLLFDQIIKEYGLNKYEKDAFIDMLIIIDFKNFKNFNRLASTKNFGIKINDAITTFMPFLKSNSMSKESLMYFINSSEYSRISKRVDFQFLSKKKVNLAKWFAYSGLVLSDVEILDDIILNKNNICIVPDPKVVTKGDFITAINADIIYKELEDYIHNKNNEAQLKYEEKINSIVKTDSDTINFLLDKIKKSFKQKSKERKKCLNKISNEIEELKKINLSEYKRYVPILVKNYLTEYMLFDGEGLISLRLKDAINKHINGNSFQIRLPFIKGMVHAVDFKKFFASHNVDEIKGIAGFNNKGNRIYKYYNINEIDMILTESQFKAIKYIAGVYKECQQVGDFFDTMNKYDYHIGIIKSDAKSEKDAICLNYQFISTIPTTFAWTSEDIVKLNTKFIETSYSDSLIENIISNGGVYSTQKEIFYLNPVFYFSTKKYKNLRTTQYNASINDACIGKLYVHGYSKFLSGDLLELLYYIAEIDFDTPLGLNNVYIPGKEDALDVMLLRSPHYTRNEIAIVTSIIGDAERDEYLSHLTGLIMINSKSGLHQRLGGADFDGDLVNVVTEDVIVSNSKQYLMQNENNLYETILIPSVISDMVNFNHNNIIDTLENTFDNHIGLISNIAFNDAYEKYMENTKFNNELNKLAIYTILSGLEIDSAKNGEKPIISSGSGTHPFIQFKDNIGGKYSEYKKMVLSSSLGNDVFRDILKCYSGIKIKPSVHEEIKFNFIKQKNDDLYAILEAYKILSNSIDCIYGNKYSAALTKNDKKVKISDYALSILERNGYSQSDMNNILDFISSREDKFYEYFKYNYHFLTNDDEKIMVLKSIYGENVDVLNPLCNFNNKGYMLLYLFMYIYHESKFNFIPIVEVNKKYIALDKVNKLDDICESYDIIDKQKCLDDIKKYAYDFANQVNSKMTKSEVISILNTTFEDLCKNNKIEELAYYKDVLNCELIFTIFSRQMIKYLEDYNEAN